MKQNENLFANMDEIIANYLSDERPAGAHVISKFDDEARWILVMTYNELLKLQPARPEQLIKADFTTADLAWEHLQEIAFIKDRLSKAKTQDEIDHWNKLIKEEENKFIEECKKYNLY